MIVAAANWLISDGSVSRPPRAEAITAFLQGVGRAAARAGLRLDGRYEPVPEVALVLAGDTFDRLASRRWLGRVKPWHRGRTVREIADGVDLGILRNGRRLLRQLARLSIRGIEVPSADHRGRPDLRSPVRVPVRLVLLEGDRDRGISAALLPAESRWNGLLRSDREHGRLSFGSRFLAGHASASGDTPRIEIRHGHEFDPCCQPPESSGAALEGTGLQAAVTRILADWPVDEMDLRQLAQRRSEAIRTYLVGQLGVPGARIFILDVTVKTEADADTRSLLGLSMTS